MYKLRDQMIVSQEVVLGDKTFNYLGPGLIMQNCTVVFRTKPSMLTMTDVRFVGCKIQIMKPLKNFRWHYASLERCTFQGEMIGCDFGHWSEIYGEYGQVYDCDFTKAILDGCRFIDIAIESLMLPKWPHYTIFEPMKYLDSLKSLTWPTATSRWTIPFDDNPPKTSAIVFYAPSVLKRLGGMEQDLKMALGTLGHIASF